ncbi:MAG: hypothetical protein C7B45_02135 [Sulfobacillus acidophilus]|uniref:Glycosyltransferase RgtA/B/C/D-like domain-containing protein n=1 Tax=Sulfobacillus acidophilus TaxID=53633 RepID=A0A2T2WMX8_9FIRM|nr:MAG: hypothetical protein C7B45_02135 [Sulfobacillus acidophilus]
MGRLVLWVKHWWPQGKAGRELWQQLLFSRVALVMVGWVALAELPWQFYSPTYNPSNNPLIIMWIRWDALWYTGIAAHGYWREALAFFPLYPLLIAAGHFFLRMSFDVSALVISNVSLILFGVTFYRLVRSYYPDNIARRAVWMVLMFPTAFFLSAAYTEALFLWLSTAAFLAARQNNLWKACIFTFFAFMTRNEGLFVIIPVLWLYYQRHQFRLSRDLIPVIVIPLGLIAFMVYQWFDFGNPLAFIAAQSYWGRHITWPWVGVVLAVEAIVRGSPLQASTVLSMIDLLAAISSGVLWVYGFKRRMPLDWLVYWGALLLIDISAPDPSGESPLLSMSRLVLVLFPNFVALAMLARNSGWRRMLQWVLPSLQAVFFVIFATWHWIA